MERRLRMHLDLLHPDTASKVAASEKSIPPEAGEEICCQTKTLC